MREVVKKYENVTDFDVKSGNVLTHYVNGEFLFNKVYAQAGELAQAVVTGKSFSPILA